MFVCLWFLTFAVKQKVISHFFFVLIRQKTNKLCYNFITKYPQIKNNV